MPQILTLFIFIILTSTAFAQTSDAYYQAMTLGENAQASRQYAQAIQHYANAIQLAPNQKEAYLRQINVAIQKRDLTTFKRTIGQLEGLEYAIPLDVYITYAQLAKKQRLYNDGLKMLDKAELRHKISKTIALHRAQLYQKLNNNAAVIKALNKALELEPQNMEVLHQLATIYMDINTRKSIDLFKKLSVDPTYKDIASSSLGLLHIKLYQADPGPNNRNNLVLALGYYNNYHKKHPQNKDTKEMIEHIRTLLSS
jgi:tetratricopeptide (TPR) repeat protein